MKERNGFFLRAILILYVIAILALLLAGYSVQAPEVQVQEFPFSVTYSYQGNTHTISDVYVAEYVPHAKYIGSNSTLWYGYVKDRDRMEADYYTIDRQDTRAFSVNLNLLPGYLMGDPAYSSLESAPSLAVSTAEGTVITDPAELEQMGFSLVSWDYPTPIENSFSYGGISLSSEATIYTTLITLAALVACLILIRKDNALTYGWFEKIGVVLNFLVSLVAFPFIFIAASLSEIVADVSPLQQLLYLTPALTVLGISLSVSLRRMGRKHMSFWVQFIGPALFALCVVLDVI